MCVGINIVSFLIGIGSVYAVYFLVGRRYVKQDLARALKALENRIMATPSGDVRDRLCDANIHLLTAQSILDRIPDKTPTVEYIDI